MLDPISIALFAAKQWGPSLIGKLMGKKAEEVASKVIDTAKELTGMEHSDSAMKMIEKDPVLAVKFKEALMDYSLQLEQEETKRLESVNATMRAEASSEHWIQYSWRPFNGFMFGITIFMNYAFPSIVNMFRDSTNFLIPGTIPEFVFMAWAAVLGVAAWHRGVAKINKIKNNGNTGISGLNSLIERTLK